jgi:ferredoxin
MPILIKKEKCPKCIKCPAINVCPNQALTQNNLQAPEVDTLKCTECRKCVRLCPFKVFES